MAVNHIPILLYVEDQSLQSIKKKKKNYINNNLLNFLFVYLFIIIFLCIILHIVNLKLLRVN